MDIVSKCKGLPLVANVLGGFLRTIEIDNWGRLLKNELWDLPKTKDEILPTLILSYLFLPPHLKRCFTYCALYPKGYDLCKEELVLQWMAQGFVEGNGSHEPEDIGNDYFDDLVARHFFQRSYADRYVMHDLNHDLAQLVMGNTKETRYMLLDWVDFDKKNLEQLSRAKGVRTLWANYCTIDLELNDLIQNFERLRVLHFHLMQIVELPESLGNLKHLRYLCLSYNGIKSLPDSICSLNNLQTLNLNGCVNLVELPRDMRNLINLQYLLISSCSQFRMLPDSICKLESLQVIKLARCKLIEALPTDIGSLKNLRHLDLYGTRIQRLPESICRLYNLEFLNLDSCNDLLEFPKDIIFSSCMNDLKFHRLDIGNGRGIRRLQNFMNLFERLYIENLENVISVEEAKLACMKNKQQIVELNLTWKQVDTLNLRDKIFEADVLEALEPAHAKLAKLTITNYCGFKLPRWMGDPSFSKIVKINLTDCVSCKLLAPLGQLCSLKRLIIDGMRELKHVGREFFGNGAFPSLQKLVLKNLPNLEGQFEVKEGDFSCITKLEVGNCPKLRELPIAPLSLEQLAVYGRRETDEFQNITALPLLPSLRHLTVSYCNEMILVNSLPHLTSVVSLVISGLPRVELLPDGLLQSLTELRDLVLHKCYKLVSLPEGLPDTLSMLNIWNCPNLCCLPKELPNMSCLKVLLVKDCPRLEIAPEELTLLSGLPHVELRLKV